MHELVNGDCLEVLKTYNTNYFDALVCDPPAGISFMGKNWDTNKGGRDEWINWLSSVMVECLRTMKPGAHGLVWALPRTSHWTAMALENAGFEVRDRVSHLFGSGFPKSLNVSKAIDAKLGFEREVIGLDEAAAKRRPNGRHTIDGAYRNYGIDERKGDDFKITKPTSPEAKQWDGWGSALKPAVEDWWLVRKPLIGSIAENVLTHGVGGINIDESKIGDEPRRNPSCFNAGGTSAPVMTVGRETVGRFPSNLLLTHHADCKLYCVPDCPVGLIGDEARYFYCGKPQSDEKEDGLESIESALFHRVNAGGLEHDPKFAPIERKNIHPTVKGIKLMTYLIRLITPPGGIVLDPFMGSGTTGVAALKGGWRFNGIEQESQYFEIAKARIQNARQGQQQLFEACTI